MYFQRETFTSGQTRAPFNRKTSGSSPVKVKKDSGQLNSDAATNSGFGYVSQFFHCNKCNKTFDNEISLRKHAFKMHEDQKAHACHLCQKTFVHEATLRVHVRKHSGIYPYCCQYCGKGFTSRGNMTGHIASQHTGQMLFHCTFCNMGFNYKSNLKMHVEKVHPGQTSAVQLPL